MRRQGEWEGEEREREKGRKDEGERERRRKEREKRRKQRGTEGRTEGVKGEVRKDGRSGKGEVGRRGKERGGKGKTVVESIINHIILKIGPLNISSQNTYTCTCSMCYVKKELDNSIMKEVGATMKEIITCYYHIIPNNLYTLLIRVLPFSGKRC